MELLINLLFKALPHLRRLPSANKPLLTEGDV
jgi:hypothetical protein